MRFGLILPMFTRDTDRVLSFARRAEQLGFDGVFAFDHLFPPGAASDRPSLEAFTTLSAVAASTEAIAVGTLVTRSVLRTPATIAKLAATIDDVSRGRMILGIGTGDPIDEPEHRVFGLPYLDTGARREQLVETVRAVRALFEGRSWPGGVHVPEIAGPLLPPPVTAAGPPVWIGGFADAVVRLAAREAHAWNGWGMSSARFARKARLLAEESAGSGRRVSPTWAGIVVLGRDEEEVGDLLRARADRGLETDVWAGTARSFGAWVESLAETGATWVVVVPAGPPDRLELIAEEVLPRVRSLR